MNKFGWWIDAVVNSAEPFANKVPVLQLLFL
jgi:hypothetical protein